MNLDDLIDSNRREGLDKDEGKCEDRQRKGKGPAGREGTGPLGGLEEKKTKSWGGDATLSGPSCCGNVMETPKEFADGGKHHHRHRSGGRGGRASEQERESKNLQWGLGYISVLPLTTELCKTCRNKKTGKRNQSVYWKHFFHIYISPVETSSAQVIKAIHVETKEEEMEYL